MCSVTRRVYSSTKGITRSYGALQTQLVAKGFNQQKALICLKISLVVKAFIANTVLTVLVSSQWQIWQLDVSNAFLHDLLHDEIYMQQGHLRSFSHLEGENRLMVKTLTSDTNY